MADRTWQFYFQGEDKPLVMPEELVTGFAPGISGVSMVELVDGSVLWIPWTSLHHVASVPNHSREEVIADDESDRDAGGEAAGGTERGGLDQAGEGGADHSPGGGGPPGGEG